MDFIKMSTDELVKLFSILNQAELIQIIDFAEEFIDDKISDSFGIKRSKYSTKKAILLKYLVFIFLDKQNLEKIYNKLTRTEMSKYIYDELIWNYKSIYTASVEQKFNYKFEKKSLNRLGNYSVNLSDELSLVVQKQIGYYPNRRDILYIDDDIKRVLKKVYPVPKDYNLKAVTSIQESEFTYSNEDKVLDFISTISDMMSNNLIEFGKTNEKPLLKTLNILKSSTDVNEFYPDKKLNLLAIDMLTRSFYYYGRAVPEFEKPEYNALKHFFLAQIGDRFSFFISRIFFAHLKRVRFDSYYSSQKNIFNTLMMIIKDMPRDDYVSFENILKYCIYRDVRLDIEDEYKTDEYYMECDITTSKGKKTETLYTETLYADDNYNLLVLEPVLKASLFYLGALGLFELKYDTPKSKKSITAKGKEYISVYDSLKYIKMTELGKYVFGFKDKYEYVKKTKKKNGLKFDEYKPIITVDKSDVITQAKLDPYTDKYDDNRYILSYSKIFKDCKTKKALDMKIEGFYKQIESNPPKVFKDFFEEIKQNSNMLKRDLKMITIELKNNKKLLNLFMKNKKLQELTIKAEGYRILVLKENIPKLTKIVKDNGFFIEF